MERGLLWLPLLVIFIGLAWAGWNEFRKVEAYQAWATQFETAKYDVLAVLGESQGLLSWGKPTRQGMVNLETFSLAQVQSLSIEVEGNPIDVTRPPQKARNILLIFQLQDGQVHKVPFTEVALAVRWYNHLRQRITALQSASNP